MILWKKRLTEKGNENTHKNLANVKKPIHLKRQQYVKGKLSLKTHPFVKTKRNKVVKWQAVKLKKNGKDEYKEETKDTDTNKETKIASIHAEVQNIMKMGHVEEGVEQSVQRKETLQNILSMLDNTSEGKEKTKIQETCKIDEPNTSAVMDSESKEKTVELKVIVEDADNDLNVKKKATKAVSSDEFSSSDSSVRNIQSDISKLIDKDVTDSGAKSTKKCVSFKIATCAQLDTSVEESLGYDTESGNNLVIDESNESNNETVVLDVVNEVVDTVFQKQENELVDSGVPLDDSASDDLSCTPPCSQIPRRDPYASKRFVFI